MDPSLRMTISRLFAGSQWLSLRPCGGAAGALERMDPSLRMTISRLFAGSQWLSLRRIRDSDARHEKRISSSRLLRMTLASERARNLRDAVLSVAPRRRPRTPAGSARALAPA